FNRANAFARSRERRILPGCVRDSTTASLRRVYGVTTMSKLAHHGHDVVATLCRRRPGVPAECLDHRIAAIRPSPGPPFPAGGADRVARCPGQAVAGRGGAPGAPERAKAAKYPASDLDAVWKSAYNQNILNGRYVSRRTVPEDDFRVRPP